MLPGTVAWVSALAQGSKPSRLAGTVLDKEKRLEDWIEKEPALLGGGLVLLARQMATQAGEIDLLALDRDGTLVVVELKKANATRLAVGQVLDYTAWIGTQELGELTAAIDQNRAGRKCDSKLADILAAHLGKEQAAKWTPETGGVRSLVASTDADPSFHRVITYLSEANSVPINALFFDLYNDGHDGVLIVRSSVLSDQQIEEVKGGKGRFGMPDAELRAFAAEQGTEDLVVDILDLWKSLTSRQPRAEKRKYWTLGSKANGTKVAAQLYPWDAGGQKGVAWITPLTKTFAEDIHVLEEDVAGLWDKAGIPLNEAGNVKITNKDDAGKVVELLTALYKVKAAAAAS